MAKKTLSYFSVIDFFGFRLAIPFENPLSLSAAVIHAMLYPKRSQSDELGTLSMQVALHTPGALLNVVHSLPADLDAAVAKRISNHPWQFPLALARNTFQIRGKESKSRQKGNLSDILQRVSPCSRAERITPLCTEYATSSKLTR